LRITREHEAILVSCAVAVSSIFVMLGQRNQLIAHEQRIESLQSDLITIKAYNNYYSRRVSEMNGEVADYRSRMLELQDEVDQLERYTETWRSYRDQLEAVYVENARLMGLLLEREIEGENFSAPTVMPRKETFRIGETVAFTIISELPLYGSVFTIRDSNGDLVWEGDPIGNWVEIEDSWVVPFYGQTAYLDPMVITDDTPLGNWTWSFTFSDIVLIEGEFVVKDPPLIS
jgi:hypothetical protein